MSTFTIRRADDHRVIGTVAHFTTANEIARCLTERGIVVEVVNEHVTAEENADADV